MKTFIKALLLAMVLSLVLAVTAGCQDTPVPTEPTTDPTVTTDPVETPTDPAPTECAHTGGTATCTEKAICELCGEAYGELAEHSYEAAVTAPTCTEAGYTTYTCACGDTYTADEVVALGHTEVVDAAVAATCTGTGLTEGKHCSVCNTVTVAQEEVAALGHTEVVDAAVAATCTGTGLTEGKHCSVCNEVIVAQEEVAALGHTEVVDAAVAATCTNTGLTEGKHCSVCNTVTVAQEVVPAGHTWDNADATVKTCTVCGEHVNPDFAGGKGTAEAPYLIATAEQLMNISNYYDTYKYYKVADGVTTLDLTGLGKANLNGSFDGNNAKIVNLTTALFLQVGYQNTAADIKISNLDVTMNAIDGCAFVRNIFNAGKTTFENIALHGYIEGLYNLGSFYNYGTANCDGTGADYTVEFINAVSDVTIVCTSGNVAGGFLGHSYEGAGNSFTMIVDEKSAFNGKILTTNGKGNLYFAMTSDYNNANNHFIVNGEEIAFNNGNIPSAANVGKITVVKPVAGENGYTVEPVEGATKLEAYLNAQVTAYDEEGFKIANKNGLTWPLGHFDIAELSELGLIKSAVIVNGTDHEFGYTVEDGVLTLYSGRSASYESGNIYLQINQYNADGELLATGTLTIYTIEHDHTFVGLSCTANGTCNCGVIAKATGHAYEEKVTAPTCTAAGYTTYTCSACGDSYKEDGEAALGHKDENADYKCDKCSTKMLPADGEALTIPQALAIGKLYTKDTYTTQKYYLTGTVSEVQDTTWGNIVIKDEAGNSILLYGLYTWGNGTTNGTRYDKMEYKPVVGDEITVYTVLGFYNAAQGKNAWLDEVVAHEHDWKAADCYNPKTCSICGVTEGDPLEHNVVDGKCTNDGCTYNENSTEKHWTLVTDVTTLKVDDQIVIVATKSNYALGTTQNNNNRASVSIVKNGDNTVTINDNVQILTLKSGTTSGTFAFYTGKGYLYAASGSSNHLKTQTSNNANGSWKIEITSAGVATIKAQGTNSRNWMRFNSSNNPPLFSCYSSGQADISIYVYK